MLVIKREKDKRVKRRKRSGDTYEKNKINTVQKYFSTTDTEHISYKLSIKLMYESCDS